MSKFNWTEDKVTFVRNNHLKLSGSDMAKHLGCDGGVVRRYLAANGLAMTKQQRYLLQAKKRVGKTSFTPEEDQFIRDNYLNMPIKTLGAEINRSWTGIMRRLKILGLELPEDVKKRNLEAGRIQKGSTPPNKGKRQVDVYTPEQLERIRATQFKKGNEPHNTRSDGEISIRKDKSGLSYQYIRIKKAKWELLQRVIWEKHHGKIPAKHVVTFKDGNTMNCNIENLELLSMEENMLRNSGPLNLPNITVAKYMATESRKVDHGLKRELLKHPELISAKRNQLLINRKIKKYGTQQNHRS